MTKAHADIVLLKQIFSRYPSISLVILFGSCAQNTMRPDSDLDVAVGADKPLDYQDKMQLIAALAEVTGREIDLVDLSLVGEPLLGQILLHGRRISGDNNAYARLLYRHVLNQADFVPYQKRILQERRRAWLGM